MVADDDGSRAESLLRYSFNVEPDIRDMPQVEQEQPLLVPSEPRTAFLRPWQQPQEEKARHIDRCQLDEEHQYAQSHHREPPDGNRARPVLSAASDKEIEYQRREDIRHQHHGEHPRYGHLGQRMQCRMACHDQCPDTDEHDQCRQDDRVLVRRQHLPSVSILVHGPLGHEDGIVVALPEDERGKDDVDDVELHSAQRHDAQYPQPAHSHRYEREQCQFEIAEGKPEEEEHDESAGDADIVEIVGQMTGYGAVHAHDVETEAVLISQPVLDALHISVLDRKHIHDAVPFLRPVDTDVPGKESLRQRCEISRLLRPVMPVEQRIIVVEAVGGEAFCLHGGTERGRQQLLMPLQEALPQCQSASLLGFGHDELAAGTVPVYLLVAHQPFK